MNPGVRWLVPFVALLAAGCSESDEPVYPEEPDTSAMSTEYDPTLEPAAAALPLVPADATTLEVTDFDQLRLTLGFGSLDHDSPAPERARFWQALSEAASLSTGLLRPVADELATYDFGQDDVAWEATYAGGADGWVLAFHEEAPLAAVQRAIRDGVGPLAGAVLDIDRALVTSAPPPEGEDSWAAIEEVVGLVGQEANTTYVERACLAFDTVFGEGMEEQLAEAPRAALKSLDPLEGFAIALGTDLATVRLGESRSDAFDRLRLAEVMPAIRPEFGAGFARGVADPSTGRLGYDLQRPTAAVELIRDQHLPFAVCGD
ncbi:hypothetical protein [Nocardioides bizhenqiangii]|uniref:DUF3352 domain-containing protein n=1 Tax=Nocardioides bizhenqiangii TaxID=3095076 RepID=A0ABZ0ZRZ3_9ACTN|nr:hypothetical protein [Nocardioides sp. HM61]WQQ26644.1 hypothetical protein SHK19_00080 [Nocardioides sp. HM61]